MRPLSVVIGQNCSHRLLLELSQDSHPQRTLLQHLGLTHGIHMWSQTVAERWKYPQHCLIKQTAELQDVRNTKYRSAHRIAFVFTFIMISFMCTSSKVLIFLIFGTFLLSCCELSLLVWCEGKALDYRHGGHVFKPCHRTYTLCIAG